MTKSAQASNRSAVEFMLAFVLMLIATLVFFPKGAYAQLDQGAIFGTVEDTTGAVIPSAQVTLTNTDTGFALQTETNGQGFYTFSPIKIGHYRASISKDGFKTLTQNNIQVNVQQRLELTVRLQPGDANTTVIVSEEPPILQTGEGSTGMTLNTQAIQNAPLNQLNWVYLVHLAPGVTPSSGTGARGAATGDFMANGQRAEQNNFILDGTDNNVNIPDFLNGSSFAVNPPPDALSQFKVQTTAFSAEFGHSAGAVVNASVKSGTNSIHGDVWEDFRDDKLNAANWNTPTKPKFHRNLFGATFGAPVIPNHLFLFGYGDGNRITAASSTLLSVPTPLMRQGDFTELLNPSLTPSGFATQLYQPGSAGSQRLSCNGQNNVICSGQ